MQSLVSVVGAWVPCRPVAPPAPIRSVGVGEWAAVLISGHARWWPCPCEAMLVGGRVLVCGHAFGGAGVREVADRGDPCMCSAERLAMAACKAVGECNVAGGVGGGGRHVCHGIMHETDETHLPMLMATDGGRQKSAGPGMSPRAMFCMAGQRRCDVWAEPTTTTNYNRHLRVVGSLPRCRGGQACWCAEARATLSHPARQLVPIIIVLMVACNRGTSAADACLGGL